MGTTGLTKKEKFALLADAQRGEPEEAMLRIQNTQISQIYGALAEHVGDLTHRMSEFPEHPHYYNGFPYVAEKVGKTLSWLRRYNIARDIEYQAEENYKYYHDKGMLPELFSSPKNALLHLGKLGLEYADRHRELPVVNDVQHIARDAAIAIGEMDFNHAIHLLSKLEAILEKGPEAWAKEAGKS